MPAPKTLFAATAALIAGLGLAPTAFAQMGPGDDRGGQGMLGMFDAIDANQDGKVTPEELKAHRAAEFTAADTNGDGALDAAELTAHALARMQDRMAERSARMIENMDNDGNGTLSADEMRPGPMENRFARIDTDDDGAISKDEAEAAMQHRKKRGHGRGMDDN